MLDNECIYIYKCTLYIQDYKDMLIHLFISYENPLFSLDTDNVGHLITLEKGCTTNVGNTEVRWHQNKKRKK